MARVSRKIPKVIEQVSAPDMKIAVYVRVSSRNNRETGTDSIKNQLALLLNAAKRFQSVESIEIYTDYAQTGTDFLRPEWERLMKDIKENRINCILVKDLSRFARNYLEAGEYLERIFPLLGVRFLAWNDSFDSAGEVFPKKEWVTELKNLANDFYSKDISKKTISAFQAKRELGEFIGNKAPYGYVLKNRHFIIDEDAAVVVRRIFAMKIQGIRSGQIAARLNQEGILSPSRYAKEHGVKKYENSDTIIWQQGAINRILYNRAYIGDLVQGKYNCSIYSKEKRGRREETAWEIKSNAHPAIIEREVFFEVQKIRERSREIWRGCF